MILVRVETPKGKNPTYNIQFAFACMVARLFEMPARVLDLSNRALLQGILLHSVHPLKYHVDSEERIR